MICNAAFLLLKCKHARSWIFPPCKYINDSNCNYSIDTHQCSHISTFSTIFLYQTRPYCISANTTVTPKRAYVGKLTQTFQSNLKTVRSIAVPLCALSSALQWVCTVYIRHALQAFCNVQILHYKC